MNARIAEHYRVGKGILAGDAAHIASRRRVGKG